MRIAWLQELDLSKEALKALVEDLFHHGWTIEHPSPRVNLLLGRRRDFLTVSVFDTPISRSNSMDVGQPPLYGYVVKKPHHPFEPKAASIASRLGLGPRIIWADQNVIVEEFLLRAWRIDATRETRPWLGPEFAEKFVVMHQNNLFHGFDDLPAHLYVKVEKDSCQICLIDWGRAKRMPTAKRDQRYFLRSKLETMAKMVQTYCGKDGYRAFREYVLQFSKNRSIYRALLE